MSYYLCYTYLKKTSQPVPVKSVHVVEDIISLWISIRSVQILFDNEIMVGVGAPCQDNVVS